MEGVTLGMNYGLRRLEKLGVKPTQIRATGGGAKSKLWRQIMADVFNACLLYTSPSPRDVEESRMPSSA